MPEMLGEPGAQDRVIEEDLSGEMPEKRQNPREKRQEEGAAGEEKPDA
jgi:hypothetical protein